MKAEQQAQKRREREVPWMEWAERMVRWLERCFAVQQHVVFDAGGAAGRADGGDEQ